MKMTIETRSTANTGEETGAQDPARLEYEKRKAEIKEKREKIEAEIWQIEVKKKSKKGGPEDEQVDMSKRMFLRKAGLAAGAGLAVAAGAKTVSTLLELFNSPKEMPKTSPSTPNALADMEKDNRALNKSAGEKAEKEIQTVEDEIENCKEIIKKEQYEEIIHNPCLVSTLYYSENAVEKMAPPHKSRNEQIVWNLYPLITTEFRKKYIENLKKITAEKNNGNWTANDARKQSLPLRIINTGKNPSENHQDAIDLFIKEGSPIYSMSRGIVVLAENNWRRDNDLSTSSVKGGNAVIVFCPEDESFYRYAHMERTKVSVGTFVGSGEEIGIVGNTGINASKPGHGEHLHLEVNRYNSNGGLMMPQNIFELKRKLETLEGQ